MTPLMKITSHGPSGLAWVRLRSLGMLPAWENLSPGQALLTQEQAWPLSHTSTGHLSGLLFLHSIHSWELGGQSNTMRRLCPVSFKGLEDHVATTKPFIINKDRMFVWGRDLLSPISYPNGDRRQIFSKGHWWAWCCKTHLDLRQIHLGRSEAQFPVLLLVISSFLVQKF